MSNNDAQSKAKSEPVVLQPDYEIPIYSDLLNDSDVPHTVLDEITIKANSKCPYGCGKIGVPILPVVFSSIDYKLTSQDQRYFAHSLTSKVTNNSAIASLPTNAYLYCYKKDLYDNSLIVFEYYTGEDGALRCTNVYHPEDLTGIVKSNGEISLKNLQESNTEADTTFSGDKQPFNCTRPEHNTLDSKYITVDFGHTLWLMVSQAKLSKAVLKKYVEDEKLRSERMQKFVYSELNNNINTVNMSEAEVGYIKSFHRRRQLNNAEEINSSIQVKESTSVSTVEYGSNKVANTLYQRMQRNIIDQLEWHEGFDSDGYDDDYDKNQLEFLKKAKPMMVALPDPVGEVIAAAEKRNYLLKQLDDAQKDKGKIREQINAIIIDNIKSNVEADHQSSIYEKHGNSRAGLSRDHNKNSAVGRNVYNYIDESKFKAVLAAAKKSRKDKESIAAARKIFVDAITNPDFAYIMREDFIENDEESNAGYTQIIAEAIQGIGIDESNIGIPDAIWADYKPEKTAGMTAKQEFEKTLLPCISEQQPIADNWLVKALIGLNKEDINRMQNAPTFENLARASDFIGTAINWAMAFKAQKQQQQIKVNLARDIERLNNLANHKAQVVQTMSSNMSHIKDNNKLLYKLDLWQQATVHQATRFKLAQRVLNYSPEAILKWSEQRLSRSINNAKPHSTLLPASIDNRVVGSASSVQTPIAIDLINSHGIDQTALDIFDKAASGDQHARTVVTMYAGEDSARATQTINQDLNRQVAQLNSDLDPINGQYSQLERSSAGKAALISAGIALFQLRSIWMGKSSLGSMARRGDRLGLEYMTGYASTTLALTSASLDVANAGMQMKVVRSVWVARLSLGVGVLGAVSAGFEVYSLELSQQRMKESGSTTSADAITIAQGAAVTAGIAGTAIALGFTMPWVVGIMAVAWGVSLVAQWIAFRYDKGHILPIHYWLDAGVFGNKAMIDINEYPNNPFKIQAMSSLEQDMHAYGLALTEIQVEPKFNTRVQDFREVLSGQVFITVSQWEDNSELVVEYIGIGNQELGLDRKVFSIEELKRQNRAFKGSHALVVILDIPKTSHYKSQYLGSARDESLNPNKQVQMQQASQSARNNPERQIKKLRVVVLYSLNPSVNPHYQLRTTVTSQ